MGKKAAFRPAQQVLNTNLVNKCGAAASSNALDTINFSSIKCHVCSRTRPVSFYSNRQILKHRNTVYNPYIPGGRSTRDYATCKDCTAAQVDTIHCFICNIDKPTTSFLKNQRSQAKPRCKACVQYCLDTERLEATPNLDHYVDDSSDESSVDGDDDEPEDIDATEDTDEDVDSVPATKKPDAHSAPQAKKADVYSVQAAKKAGVGTATAGALKKKASMTLIEFSDSEGDSTPITKTWGNTPASKATPVSRATPAQVENHSDNDVNGSDGGAWETVKVAGKTNSAYRTPTWASLAASGKTTPAAASTAGYSTTTRTTTTARTSVNSGFASPATSYSSTGRQKWGKPAKLKAGAVVEDVWVSEVARRNEWKAYGGQPKLVKPRARAHNNESDGEEEEDDGEE